MAAPRGSPPLSAEQAGQRRLFDGEGRGAGGQAVDHGLGVAAARPPAGSRSCAGQAARRSAGRARPPSTPSSIRKDLHLGVVLEVARGLALGRLVERRLGDIEVAALDQLRHLPVEEGQQQGADVGAVDVGVGHDDDLVVAHLVGVEVVAADAGAQRRDQGADLLGAQHLVEAGALDVQDLAAQRQHGLVLAVAGLLGRAAGGVALDDEESRTWPDRAPGSRRACRAGR